MSEPEERSSAWSSQLSAMGWGGKDAFFLDFVLVLEGAMEREFREDSTSAVVLLSAPALE